MPDEVMKYFLEHVLDSCYSFCDALTLALEYYNVAVAEKDFHVKEKITEERKLER
ncbi:MAG: hypothetical protein HFI74_02710 [Lachnospiraceae bacterium]|mgnify:CR=1 FL=1|jgi:hypothetical protein|nr:hypothetical protein [Lachnospiraceae bacterium]